MPSDPAPPGETASTTRPAIPRQATGPEGGPALGLPPLSEVERAAALDALGDPAPKKSGRRLLSFRKKTVDAVVSSEVVVPPPAPAPAAGVAKLKEPFPSERPPGAPVDPWTAFASAPERPPGLILRATRAFFRSLIHEYAVAIYAGLLLAVALTWPTLRYPLHTLPEDLGDPARQAWQISWIGHILLSDPQQLWQSNAFYPQTDGFAFGDSLLGYGPVGMLGDGPLAATLRYNILFVLAHALLAIGGYALVRQLGAGRTGAAVAAVAIAYAPWRLAQEGHLDIISAGGIPLALAMLARGHGWSLRRGLQPRERNAGWAAFGWLVAAWQVSLGFSLGLPFLGVLGLIVLLLLFGTPLIWLRRRFRRRAQQRHLSPAPPPPDATGQPPASGTEAQTGLIPDPASRPLLSGTATQTGPASQPPLSGTAAQTPLSPDAASQAPPLSGTAAQTPLTPDAASQAPPLSGIPAGAAGQTPPIRGATTAEAVSSSGSTTAKPTEASPTGTTGVVIPADDLARVAPGDERKPGSAGAVASAVGPAPDASTAAAEGTPLIPADDGRRPDAAGHQKPADKTKALDPPGETQPSASADAARPSAASGSPASAASGSRAISDTAVDGEAIKDTAVGDQAATATAVGDEPPKDKVVGDEAPKGKAVEGAPPADKAVEGAASGGKGRKKRRTAKHQAPKPPRIRVAHERDFFPVLGWRLLIIDSLGPIILAGIATLIALPYFHLADKSNGTAEIKFFSPPLWSLLIGPAESRIWGSPHAGARASLGWAAEMSLLPGFVLYALALAGLWFSIWKFSRRILLIIALAASIVLTIGTHFFGGRWTYLPLFGHLPASLGQRIPGRMMLWVTLLLGILAAGAVAEFVRRAEHWSAQRIPPWPAWWLRLATLVPLILVLGEGWNTTSHPVVPAQPAPMRTITSPMLVLPTGAVTDGTVMLWSTTRYQKIANGSGGFAAAQQAQMRSQVANFPDAASIEYLRSINVTTVLLVRSSVAGTSWERAGDTPVDSLGITREDVGTDVVFHLR
jgi:hypothetical protein